MVFYGWKNYLQITEAVTDPAFSITAPAVSKTRIVAEVPPLYWIEKIYLYEAEVVALFVQVQCPFVGVPESVIANSPLEFVVPVKDPEIVVPDPVVHAIVPAPSVLVRIWPANPSSPGSVSVQVAEGLSGDFIAT